MWAALTDSNALGDHGAAELSDDIQVFRMLGEPMVETALSSSEGPIDMWLGCVLASTG